MSATDQTIQYQSSDDGALSPGVSVARSGDVSRAQVGFVEHHGNHFSHETTELLRRRLTAAACVITLVLGIVYISNRAIGEATLQQLSLVVLILNCLATSCLVAWPELKHRQLRRLELLVFGSVAMQLALMAMSRIGEYAVADDAVSMVAVRYTNQASWCVLIFTYGILMPNTWKRGAMIMFPLAAIPHVIVRLQAWFDPTVGSLLAKDHAAYPISLPLMSAFIATFATQVINQARRDAYKAKMLGQYRLMELLGAGGMGEVYKAEHMLLKRPCAIKLIRPDKCANAETIARFEKEVKATAQLTHWNTVEIFDYGRSNDGTFYYVMELLPGMSLEELVKKFGPVPPARTVYLLCQVCDALKEAHAAGLIHRDIKPANIFVTQRGGVFDVAKLLDFGLVKSTTNSVGEVTDEGSIGGTPDFMSPEQAIDYGHVDGRADIYSLGATAYYLLTGRLLFEETSVIKMLAAHRKTMPTPPSARNAAVPPELDAVIMKCLAKSPADRYQSVKELRSALATATTDSWNADLAALWWRAYTHSE